MNQCPDCKGELERGAILDFTHNNVLVQRYGEGAIPEGKQGLFYPIFEGDFKNLRRVVSLRCKNCNRIFQYAQTEVVIEDLKKRNKKISIFLIAFILIIVIMTIVGIIVTLPH